jgi:hypothetical protein
MAIIDTSLRDLTNKLQAMLEAAAVAEADLQCTFDCRGSVNVPCVGGPQFEGKMLSETGSWEKKRMVKIKFRLVSLSGAPRPQENDVVVYRDSAEGPENRYRVQSTKVWFNALMELECVDSNI